MASNLTHISKFLSYILRHHPEDIGLKVDDHGWAHLPSLIKKSQKHGKQLDRSNILKIMESSAKQRFSLSDDSQYIRAGYGHSIEVDLDLEPRRPPEILYHGTAVKNLSSIKKAGLHPQNRNMVHLSSTKESAISVGRRHGKPAVLTIEAIKLHKNGYPLYQSDSEPSIWMVQKVPAKYIDKN